MTKKIVILGIGNVLLNDEGIGVKVIEYLQRHYEFPEEVELVDGGTGGIGLLEFVEKADILIVIDAINGGEPPGTVYKFSGKELPRSVVERLSLHEVNFLDILDLAAMRGNLPEKIVIIGVEPKSLEMEAILSPEVQAKIPELADAVIGELKALGVKNIRSLL